MNKPARTPFAPHLIKATYNWLSENNEIPHITVNALYPGVDVPISHVKDGIIVLNISMQSTHHLTFGNDTITFHARFGGKSMDIVVPYGAVQAVYGRGTNVGMIIPQEAPPSEPEEAPATPSAEQGSVLQEQKTEEAPRLSPPKRGHLSIVK